MLLSWQCIHYCSYPIYPYSHLGCISTLTFFCGSLEARTKDSTMSEVSCPYHPLVASWIAKATKVFNEMPDRDTVSYDSMLVVLVWSGNVMKAHTMFDNMPEKDMVSLNTMLDRHVKADKINSAFELFERMSKRNVMSWSTMVSRYCTSHQTSLHQNQRSYQIALACICSLAQAPSCLDI